MKSVLFSACFILSCIFSDQVDSTSIVSFPAECQGDTCAIGELEKFRRQDVSGDFYRIPIPAGEHTGVSVQIDAQTSPLQLSLSYQLRLSKMFAEHMPNQVGKLPGFSGTTQKEGYGGHPANGKGWSARLGFAPAQNGCVPIGYYVYHMEQTTQYGDFFQFACLEREQWHDIKLQAQVFSDGRVLLGAIIDDEKRFLQSFQATIDLPTLKPWVDIYYGGIHPAESDMYVDLDSVGMVNLLTMKYSPNCY